MTLHARRPWLILVGLVTGTVMFRTVSAATPASGMLVSTASSTGYAFVHTSSPPTMRAGGYRLPGALGTGSAESPPILIGSSSFVAVDTKLSPDLQTSSMGLVAWTLRGKLLWSYRPANLQTMTPPVWTGHHIAVVALEKPGPNGSTPAQTLVELTPSGRVVMTHSLPPARIETLSWSSGGLVATVLTGGRCGVERFSASGALVWSRPAPYCQSSTQFGTSLLLANTNTVRQNGLDAVSGLTGHRLWTAVGPERPGWAVLGVSNGVAVVKAPGPLPYVTDIEGINVRSGKTLWRRRIGDLAIRESPPSYGPSLVANHIMWVDCPDGLEQGSLTCSLRSLRTGATVHVLHRVAPSVRGTVMPIAISNRYVLICVDAVQKSGYWLVSLKGHGVNKLVHGWVDGGLTYNRPSDAMTVQPDGVVWRW